MKGDINWMGVFGIIACILVIIVMAINTWEIISNNVNPTECAVAYKTEKGDVCKESDYSHCGYYLSDCISGKKYSCSTNVEIVYERC